MAKDRKKRRTHVKPTEEEFTNVPRSFVMRKGNVGKSVTRLMMDMRHVMEPFTALKLRVRKNNTLKDFVNVAGPIGVTHFLIFSKTSIGTYLRLVRLPKGPTLSFRVHAYSLASDVLALQKTPHPPGNEYKFSPLLVLNNFNKEGIQFKLMISMFQNMFPSINIESVKLGNIRRCVLLNYDEETNRIEFRHYVITVQSVGVSKPIKALLESRIPDLSNLNDISDFILSQAAAQSGTKSDDEDNSNETSAASQVTVTQTSSKGATTSKQSSIKLLEAGPRMTLSLVRVEQGVCDGDVIYHQYIKKSAEEIKALKQKKDEQKKLKLERKRQQEANVARKQKEREEHKAKSMEGIERKKKEWGIGRSEDDDEDEDDYDPTTSNLPNANDEDDDDEGDNDAEWFRKEVGVEPDADLFGSSAKGSRGMKRRFEKDTDSGGGKKFSKKPRLDKPGARRSSSPPSASGRKSVKGFSSGAKKTSAFASGAKKTSTFFRKKSK